MSVKSWRQRTKQRMIDAMGGKCQCCGYDKCNASLAFHHINPEEKDFSFGAIRANPKSWESIVVELRKCILVCHNCHSEIHSGVTELPETYATFDENFAEYKELKEFTPCVNCGELTPKKFCSSKCAATNRRKVDWDSIDLIGMLEKYKISELEEMLGVSNAAIYKRRDKILKDL